MINVGLYYRVKSGNEKQFEDTFAAVSEYLSSGKGFKLAKLYKEVGTNEYMIYSEWDSLNAFTEFVRSEAFHKVTSSGKDILEGQPRHRIFYEQGKDGS
ncbi:MAG: antibiotic biosynthesis monooxygenase [Candidatus Marsarchaeota archaeon]|nr:antibiotic biosynthesis monooxygenase [Candidatus Marsarchaeota archaeon]